MVPECPERKSKGAEIGLVRLSVQVPVAESGCTLGARLSVQSSALHKNSRVLTLFHPKSPISISQHPNMFPKIVYRFMNSKGLFKTHQTWNQISFQHNSSIQPIFTKPSTTTPFIPQICNYEHPRYELSTTTTTSIKHEFINNPSTTIHSTSIWVKHKYTCIYTIGM